MMNWTTLEDDEQMKWLGKLEPLAPRPQIEPPTMAPTEPVSKKSYDLMPTIGLPGGTIPPPTIGMPKLPPPAQKAPQSAALGLLSKYFTSKRPVLGRL